MLNCLLSIAHSELRMKVPINTGTDTDTDTGTGTGSEAQAESCVRTVLSGAKGVKIANYILAFTPHANRDFLVNLKQH